MHQIKLKGSAKAQGQAHGETFRRQIRELYEVRKLLVDSIFSGIAQDKIEQLLQDQVTFLQRFSRSYDEFEGIAHGSGLSLTELMALNNYTDFRDFVHAYQKQGEDLGGCSLLAVRDHERCVSGQTWDMHASATPYILHIESEDPIPHHILTVTGGMALAGVNAHGVSVFINNMHCNETHIGIMWGALVKEMLLCESAKQALDFLKVNLPCSGHNYLICDLDDSINVETTGKRFEVTYDSSEPGVVFHTNHYVSTLRETEVLSMQSKTTHARHEALQNYFDQKRLSDLTYDTLVQDVFAGQAVSAVCIRPTKNPEDASTCGGLICDLKARKGEIFAGLYTEGDVHTIQW